MVRVLTPWLTSRYPQPWRSMWGWTCRRPPAASRNAYKGGTRGLLRELARLLREQGEALKRIG